MRFIVRCFDIFAAPLFKSDRGGRPVFFPWGFWGPGYVLPSQEAAERLRRSVRTSWAVLFLLGIPVISLIVLQAMAGDFLGFVAIGGAAGLGMSLYFRSMTRGMERSDTRLSMREAQDAKIQAMGRSGLRVMSALSLVLMVLGGAVLVGGGRDSVPLASAMVAIFGACVGAIAWHWRRLKRIGG